MRSSVANSRVESQKPRRWKSMLIHQGWFTALYTQHLLDAQSLEFEICIFPREAIPSHYFPVPSLGLGTTWVRQLLSAVVIIPPLPPNVANSRVEPQKPRRWKSMLIHQGWFTALYTQHLLDSQSLEFEICIFPREAIPSHYFPVPSLGLGTTWVMQLLPAVVIIPPLPPNVANSRVEPQKPRRWKSMLIHQGWFTALCTQHLLDSQSLEFEICTFPREAIPSH